MGVTPAELEANNGKFVVIVDFAGQVYEGILHYRPEDGHYSIQIWTNSCCFITFIAPEDVTKLISDPCIITPCCPVKCLPGAMLMDITGANLCSCLIKNYLLEWNQTKQKYEFDYPGICGCATFHIELACFKSKWVCYLAFKNEIGFTCMDGINLDFPINCSTMKGEAQINFTKTGTCNCGPCVNSLITVKFSPV